MNRVAVESSQIASIGHDQDASVLEIEFKGGTIYQYQNVGAEVYTALYNADSVGSYFIRVIKKHPENYPYTKVSE